MTLYQGYTYEERKPRDYGAELLTLGAELRRLMGYEAAVAWALDNGNNGTREIVRRAEDKIAEIKDCDHVFVDAITSGMTFIGGEVDGGEMTEPEQYCPKCGALKLDEFQQYDEALDAWLELPI